MKPISHLEAEVISACGYHRRLCEAYDAGQQVDVALKLAHQRLTRARSALEAVVPEPDYAALLGPNATATRQGGTQ